MFVKVMLRGCLCALLLVLLLPIAEGARSTNPDGSLTISVKLGGSASESTGALQAIAFYHGYQATINGSPNPETRAQFVDRLLREQVLAWVKEGRAVAAAQAARATEDAKPLVEVQ